MADPYLTSPIWNHILELRRRLMVSVLALILAFVVAYLFYPFIVAFLMKPFLGDSDVSRPVFVITGVVEGFASKIKFSYITAVFLSFPVHLLNGLLFVLPGLKKREKKLLLYTVVFSTILGLLSIYFGYFYFVPFCVQFLMSSDFIPADVSLFFHFQENLLYVINFMLCLMLTFQFPIVLEVLLYLNVIKLRRLWKATRYVLVIIFIIAAIITPPDFVSQLSVALPMIALYFLTLLVAYVFRFGRDA